MYVLVKAKLSERGIGERTSVSFTLPRGLTIHVSINKTNNNSKMSFHSVSGTYMNKAVVGSVVIEQQYVRGIEGNDGFDALELTVRVEVIDEDVGGYIRCN